MKRILVIQTAFIGDVILATGLLEKLHQHYPEADIEMLVRKGNESLLKDHPFVKKVHVWDKKGGKYRNLFALIKVLRQQPYDLVVNLQRFAASGYITWRVKAKQKVGFAKNPFAFAYDRKEAHQIGDGTHEIARNHQLIAPFTDEEAAKPRLYPSAADEEKVAGYQGVPYVTVSPTSVWFTKQFPAEKWLELMALIPSSVKIYLLGAPADAAACEELKSQSSHAQVEVLAGKLSLLQSAALMKEARMNYVNDSAPQHLASAMNAPVSTIFCSTIPAFGFGPLSDQSHVIEVSTALDCRPCGLHGHKACPKGHFNCALQVDAKKFPLPE